MQVKLIKILISPRPAQCKETWEWPIEGHIMIRYIILYFLHFESNITKALTFLKIPHKVTIQIQKKTVFAYKNSKNLQLYTGKTWRTHCGLLRCGRFLSSLEACSGHGPKYSSSRSQDSTPNAVNKVKVKVGSKYSSSRSQESTHNAVNKWK